MERLNSLHHSKQIKTLTMLLEFLKEFLPTYNTYQLCIIAVKQGDGYKNLLTSIRFSYTINKNNLSDWSNIETAFKRVENVKFFYRTYEPQTIFRLIKEISEKRQISFSYNHTNKRRIGPPFQYKIHYESLNPSKLNVIENRRGSRNLDLKWNTFMVSKRCENEIRELWRIVDRYQGLVIQLGYRSIKDFRQEVFGVDREEIYFFIDLPVYALIKKLTHQEIILHKHHALENLQINLILQRYDGSYQNIDRNRIQITHLKHDNNDFFTTTIPIKFQQEVKYKDRIEATLINTKVASLKLDDQYILVPFLRVTESFSQAVFEFYPLEEFREHLFSPELFRKPDDVFQDAVVMLLSLADYSVVILGKKRYRKHTGEKSSIYETLRLDTGYPIGSADLLAYREEELLLVDCTISSPDEKKILKLPELVDHLKNLTTDVSLNITSFIFTPKDGMYEDYEDVRIIYGSKLEEILELILNNEILKARLKLFELRDRYSVAY